MEAEVVADHRCPAGRSPQGHLLQSWGVPNLAGALCTQCGTFHRRYQKMLRCTTCRRAWCRRCQREAAPPPAQPEDAIEPPPEEAQARRMRRGARRGRRAAARHEPDAAHQSGSADSEPPAARVAALTHAERERARNIAEGLADSSSDESQARRANEPAGSLAPLLQALGEATEGSPPAPEDLTEQVAAWTSCPAPRSVTWIPRPMRGRWAELVVYYLQWATEATRQAATQPSQAALDDALAAHRFLWSLPGLLLRALPSAEEGERDRDAEARERTRVLRGRFQAAERGE